MHRKEFTVIKSATAERKGAWGPIGTKIFVEGALVEQRNKATGLVEHQAVRMGNVERIPSTNLVQFLLDWADCSRSLVVGGTGEDLAAGGSLKADFAREHRPHDYYLVFDPESPVKVIAKLTGTYVFLSTAEMQAPFLEADEHEE